MRRLTKQLRRERLETTLAENKAFEGNLRWEHNLGKVLPENQQANLAEIGALRTVQILHETSLQDQDNVVQTTFREIMHRDWDYGRDQANINFSKCLRVFLDEGYSGYELDQEFQVVCDYPLLLRALDTGDYDLTKRLLEHGLDPNRPDDDGDDTPLHVAAEMGNERLAELLVDKGANVNALNQSNRTPLHLAVIHDKPAMSRLLLRHGAKTCLGTPIFDHCDGTSPEYLVIGRLLLEAGARVNAGTGPDLPLAQALRWGTLDWVQVLLRRGAHVHLLPDSSWVGLRASAAGKNMFWRDFGQAEEKLALLSRYTVDGEASQADGVLEGHLEME